MRGVVRRLIAYPGPAPNEATVFAAAKVTTIFCLMSGEVHTLIPEEVDVIAESDS